MLGEGIVSFGRALVVTDRRNSNASPKIVCSSSIVASTCAAAGVNSIVPSSLRNCTTRSSATRVTPPSW
jgi:hypothetical protein